MLNVVTTGDTRWCTQYFQSRDIFLYLEGSPEQLNNFLFKEIYAYFSLYSCKRKKKYSKIFEATFSHWKSKLNGKNNISHPFKNFSTFKYVYAFTNCLKTRKILFDMNILQLSFILEKKIDCWFQILYFLINIRVLI